MDQGSRRLHQSRVRVRVRIALKSYLGKEKACESMKKKRGVPAQDRLTGGIGELKHVMGGEP